jgi:hypothetical protein
MSFPLLAFLLLTVNKSYCQVKVYFLNIALYSP